MQILHCALVLLTAVALGLPLGAQTELGVGDIGSLPVDNGSTPSADHAIVASNDLGDLLIVWDEVVQNACSGSSTGHQAVAIFLPTKDDNGTRKWEIDSARVTVVGTECVEFGAQSKPVDCSKPHVVGAGTNFIVAFPRQKGGKARVESVGAEVSDLGASTYNTAAYHFDTTDGVGYNVSVVDFTDGIFDVGESGGNVGLAWYKGTTTDDLPQINGVALVYLDEDTPYKYDLYAVYVDYNNNGIENPAWMRDCAPAPDEWLVSGIASEEDEHYARRGAVAPRLIEDDNGLLLLTYGEWDAEDDTVPTPADGRITARSYRYDECECLTELDSVEFEGSDATWHHRRPVTGTTAADGNNYIGLGWTTYSDTNSGHDAKIDWRKITIHSANGAITEVSDYEPNTSNLNGDQDVEHARAVFAANGPSSLYEAVLYRHREATLDPTEIKSWTGAGNPDRVDNAASGDHTDRPAYTIIEDLSGESYMVVVWDQLVSGKPRPMITVIDIS